MTESFEDRLFSGKPMLVIDNIEYQVENAKLK